MSSKIVKQKKSPDFCVIIAFLSFKNLRIMKNILGKTAGFIIGAGGFLILFKVFFIANVPPADELAPGIVMLSAIAFGVLLAYIGSIIQTKITH